MVGELIKPVKGMKDYYPESWIFQKWLSSKWLSLGSSFGYQDFEGPILEPVELYLKKSSEEIVNRQTFRLVDRKNNGLVLRPELTPTLARMIAQRENTLYPPIRWQSYGRFFRYEKPQRGRGRSFFQWNIDLIGSEDILADAEMLAIAGLSLKCLGILPEDARLRISNRKIMQKMLSEQAGIPAELHLALFKIIDRIDKLSPDVFAEGLLKSGLTDRQCQSLLQVLKERDPSFFPGFKELFRLLKVYEVDEYCEIDFSVIRGFDYYTGLVFEAWAKSGLKRALFGGGRYDNLTRQVGGRKKLSGVGLAAGDMAVCELLMELNRCPSLLPASAGVLVTVFSPDLREDSVRLATNLRKEGISVELYSESGDRLDRQIRYADRNRIPLVIILGPDEKESKTVTLKILNERNQKELSFSELTAFLTRSRTPFNEFQKGNTPPGKI